MSIARIVAPFLMLAALVGCADHKGPPPPTFSPNGEPLVPPQWPLKCEDALDAWFDRVDTGHAGALTLAQLQADALVQYHKMDLRHDGKVTAEELSKYRLAQMHGHMLSVSTPGQKGWFGGHEAEDDDSDASDLDRAFGDPDRHHKGEHRPTDAYAALVTDQPDPVMTADTDLDGSVTWEEFRALVAQNFADFDKDHKGVITKSEVETLCDRKP